MIGQRRPLAILVALAFVAATSTYIPAADLNRPLIRRAMPPPDVKFRPVGRHSLEAGTLRYIGGVISQAWDIVDAMGSPANVHVAISDDDEYPGYLSISIGESNHQYTISYTDLVPMAMFVDSQRTSLYTLWDDDVLPENYAQNAGLVDHVREGHIAFEFSNTRFERPLHYVDTCHGCVGEADSSLRTRTNNEISQVSYSNLGLEDMIAIDGTYLNLDSEPEYSLHNSGTAFQLRGRIARYYPKTEVNDDNTVSIFIEKVSSIVRSEQLNENTERIISEARIAGHEISSYVIVEFRRTETSHEAKTSLDDVYFLFETLALLRSAKTSEPHTWAMFLRALASDPLVQNQPEPWIRYTRSYCRVDATMPECETKGN